MRLVEVDLTLSDDALPDNVARLLADAQRRVDQLEDETRAAIPAFVPSDFEAVYRALSSIKSGRLATGRRLVEWGSGIGAVTCLAVLVDYDAVGIEIESKLVTIAEDLAHTHHIETQFALGSFVPHGAQPRLDWTSGVSWLSTGGPDGYAELELDPDDFDIIFAYPWPGEEQVIFDLFTDCAAVGTLLLTYHGQEGLRLHRKIKR
jgi:hypothetical protein